MQNSKTQSNLILILSASLPSLPFPSASNDTVSSGFQEKDKMEEDLSLIEISGEDDSLLSSVLYQQSPNGTVSSSSSSSYFSCSPLLQIPRSIISTEEDAVSKPSCSSSCEELEDSKNNENIKNMNKENTNLNNEEAPKSLSIEPQQMKRKKKGGGFNLRKSLAWNRAFFTDEGVLDPLELSMLSGNLGKPNMEMLSVIHEGTESLSGDLDNAGDFRTLDDNLSKDLPSPAPNQSRKIAAISLKLGSPARHNKIGPASTAKRKVLAAHDINRSASKRSGCPRPVASSSLKRPSNTNTTKVVNKDSRVSKLLAPKPAPSVVSTSSRGTIPSAGKSKRNVISQPGNAQRNAGLKQSVGDAQRNASPKGTSTSTKMAKNDTRTGPSRKLITNSSIQPAKRNVVKVSSVPKIHSSCSVQIPQVSKGNNSLELIQDPITTARPAYSNESNTGKFAISFSQNACYNGGNMQPTPPQTAKPSGLRMPSPSLGFFGQSNPSGSHSLLQKTSPPCNLAKSNIPKFSKDGTLNPIQKRPPRPFGSLPAHSSTVHSMASTVNSASTAKIKSNLEPNYMKKLTLQLQSNSEIYETNNHKQQLYNICDDVDRQSLDCAAPCKIGKSSCMENIGLQSNNNELTLQSSQCEQLEKDDHNNVIDVCFKSRDSPGAVLDYHHITSPLSLQMEFEGPQENIIIVNQQMEDRKCNLSIKNDSTCSESQYAEVKLCVPDGALEVHVNQLSDMHEANRQGSQQAELVKPDTCIVDPISDVESHSLKDTSLEESTSFEEISKYGRASTADVLLEEQDGANSYCPSHLMNEEHAEGGSTGVNCLNKELHARDAQMLSDEGNLLVECSKSLMNTSMLVNSNLMVFDNPYAYSAEQSELPKSPSVMEQVLQDQCRLLSSGCLVQGYFSEESWEKDVVHSVRPAELRRTNDCEGELGSFDVSYSMPTCNRDCDFGQTGRVECLHVENAPIAAADSKPAFEVFRHGAKLCGEANTLALENTSQSNMIGAVVSGNAEVNDLCTNRGDLSRSNIDVNDLCSNGGELDTSVDFREKDTLKNVSDIILEQCKDCPSESTSSDACLPAMQDDGSNVDQNADPLGSMVPSVEIHINKHDMDCDYRNDYELDNQSCPLSFGPSCKSNGDQMPLAAHTFDSKPFCSLDEKTNEKSSRDIQQSMLEDLSGSNILPVEAETNIHQRDGGSNSELQDGLHSIVYSREVEDATISAEKSVNDKKQDALVIRPPSNAVPFSDEWLAAFEAAGEEILARKGGAVQNSPPDKSEHEPNPWSPVRRKNNQGIGPYDCTKFTNHESSTSKDT